MKERGLHVSTALLPVKNLPSALIEKLGGLQRLAGRLEKTEKLAHAHEPNLGSSASHPLAKSLYWLNCYVTIDTLHLLKNQEPKNYFIYRQLVGRFERDLMNVVACCVDLWESRLYGYGWPTVDYFHTKLREIRAASVQVAGRDTRHTL